MKQARIVTRQPVHHGRLFWYVLLAVDPPSADGTPLQHASAHWLKHQPSQVDPEARRAVLASLNAWADDNGWTVVSA